MNEENHHYRHTPSPYRVHMNRFTRQQAVYSQADSPMNSNNDKHLHQDPIFRRHDNYDDERYRIPISNFMKSSPGMEGGNADLTLEEKRFLAAVERGDLATTRKILATTYTNNEVLDEHKVTLNINAMDLLGRTALSIAIEYENLEMMELLLSHPNIHTGNALLHAINEEFVEAVELLLAHEESIRLKMKSESSDNLQQNFNSDDVPPKFHSGVGGSSWTSPYTNDITPLILAAHKDNYEIIKILLDRGDEVPEPHNVRCACDECRLSQQIDSLRHSRSRINAYRALSSPSLISLSSRDPILTAFELSYELKTLSRVENEFRSEYEELANQCQDYAASLLGQTTSSDELEVILNHDSENPAASADTNEKMTLARLKLGIKYKQKKFVAHPHCQQLLAAFWYEGLPGFRRHNNFVKILIIIAIGCLFPLLAILYLLMPKSKFGRIIRQPFIKFICASASYLFFLLLLVLASQRIKSLNNIQSSIFSSDQPDVNTTMEPLTEMNSFENSSEYFMYPQIQSNRSKRRATGSSHSSMFGAFSMVNSNSYSADYWGNLKERNKEERRGPPPTSIEWIIVAYVAGFIWAEIKQLYEEGWEEYLSDWWNLLDWITNSMYITTIALRIAAYFRVSRELKSGENLTAHAPRKDWDSWEPTLIAEGIFAAANVFSSLKLVYIFTINPHLGPLQISLGRMVFDITKFLLIILLVAFAFACGLNQLYWYYASMRETECKLSARDHTSSTNMHFNEIYRTCMEESKHFSNLFETLQTLFWAVFGLIELQKLNIYKQHYFTMFVGLLMFGVYNCIMNIVLLNMLIAMMSNSYQVIANKADLEWKFARSKLWISYFEEGATLPSPFNIIPSPKSIYYIMKWFYLQFSTCTQQNKKSRWQSIRKLVRRMHERETKYQMVIQNILRRYVTKKQERSNNAAVTTDDLNEIKQDVSAFRFELLEILKTNNFKINTIMKKTTANKIGRKRTQMTYRNIATRNTTINKDLTSTLNETFMNINEVEMCNSDEPFMTNSDHNNLINVINDMNHLKPTTENNQLFPSSYSNIPLLVTTRDLISSNNNIVISQEELSYDSIVTDEKAKLICPHTKLDLTRQCLSSINTYSTAISTSAVRCYLKSTITTSSMSHTMSHDTTYSNLSPTSDESNSKEISNYSKIHHVSSTITTPASSSSSSKMNNNLNKSSHTTVTFSNSIHNTTMATNITSIRTTSANATTFCSNQSSNRKRNRRHQLRNDGTKSNDDPTRQQIEELSTVLTKYRIVKSSASHTKSKNTPTSSDT
ncbi:hypothetical protein SNEBB_009258 [Seison nebaliae]|nr:hypothetical protein SNEBB_009258 [Seison nebaliae]